MKKKKVVFAKMLERKIAPKIFRFFFSNLFFFFRAKKKCLYYIGADGDENLKVYLLWPKVLGNIFLYSRTNHTLG